MCIARLFERIKKFRAYFEPISSKKQNIESIRSKQLQASAARLEKSSSCARTALTSNRISVLLIILKIRNSTDISGILA